MAQSMNRHVDAMETFYQYANDNVTRELIEFYGWDEEKVAFELERKDLEAMDEEVIDLRWQSLMLFYEQETDNTGRWMLGEVWNDRKHLKTLMSLHSVADRTGQTESFEGLNIVDYGSGSGWVGLPIALMGANVTLFEFGHTYNLLQDRKKGLGLPDLQIQNPHIDPLKWDQNNDIIISYEVMEHVHDPLSLLVIFNRALKMGGLLYLTYSFGPGSFMHLEENQIYHAIFHELVPKFGFSPAKERRGFEEDFPVHIFEKQSII